MIVLFPGRTFYRAAPVLFALLLVPAMALAGTLGDFEKDATGTRRSTDQSGKKKEESDAKAGAGSSRPEGSHCLFGDFLDIMLSDDESAGPSRPASAGPSSCLLSDGGAESWSRVESMGMPDAGGKGVRPRREGEALIPVLRIDVTYQNAGSDITAWDYRFEAGYGPVGFQMRRTVYDENAPAASLEVFEYHALYRMSAGSKLEVDLGVGAMILNGLQSNNGYSVTVPILYHPTDFYGLEFRPVWSSINENDIQDFDLAVLFGWRYASVKAGYRWLRSPHQSLDGPEIGIALRW